MKKHETDLISMEQAGSLGGLFRERVRRSPNAIAYMQFNPAKQEWERFSWRQTVNMAARWQVALQRENLAAGDRVAMMLRNCVEWVVFDQAATGLGLVTVPLFPNDRAENIGYILQDAGVKLLLIEDQTQWQKLREVKDQLTELVRIVSLQPVAEEIRSLMHVDNWLPETPAELITRDAGLDELATIVYTSGTTGRSKGVMLSHRNILWNAWTALHSVVVYYPDDVFLSFLPLSHTLERTVGYYAPIMTGSSVAFARSIPQLGEDLLEIKPTLLVSVPRIFERVYTKIQAKLEEDPAIARFLFNKAVEVGWKRFLFQQRRGPWTLSLLLWPVLEKLVAAKIKQKLGGHLRFSMCGGAPLSPDIARLFIGLGIPILQGYGLTETSPIVSANPLQENIPESVGIALKGVDVKIGENDELLTKSPSVMLGYWANPEATAQIVDNDGWLHTGDQARIEGEHIFITGRLKEIIVLANGEKSPPADMEMAIATDSLFEQIMIVGEGKPFMTALVVLNQEKFIQLATATGVNPDRPESSNDPAIISTLIERMAERLHSFPGYAQIFSVFVVRDPWTIDNGMMTPTLKLRRNRILERYHPQVEHLYEGH